MNTPPMDHKIHRPKGRWTPAANTNVAETFRRIREEQAKEALRQFAGWKR